MFNTKKDLDNHVRLSFAKLRTDKDRALRGFTIAKLYFKMKEYPTAIQYLSSFLSQKEDNDQAHKMLGQCYKFSKQPSKALQSFQRSLQLNPKQPELLTEVCQMLLADNEISCNKAKYWCELAESEKVENEAVYELRLKIMNQSSANSSEIENILRKEISSRPNEVNPRVRLIRHFLDQQRIVDAFKYVHEFELQQNEQFVNSSDWYNILWTVLNKYEQLKDAKKDWNFWFLVALCLERLVYLSFSSTETFSSGAAGSTTAIAETANALFLFDQYLFKINQMRDSFDVQKELLSLFIEHYRGQLALYAVALIFKRELLQKKNKWRETMLLSLPLLLLAFHAEPKENKEPWMKHCDENNVKLIKLWYREGTFRCAQAGRVLLSSIKEDNKENSKIQINSYFGTQTGSLWGNADELLAQVRKTCVDTQWRRNIFAQIFCNSDQRVKEQTSLFVKCEAFAEPVYDLPTEATLQEYEEAAQYLRPNSLAHMVYLHLNYDDLSSVSAKYFNGLKFSVPDLAFCGAESLNQLDIDCYLYAAIIETKRFLEVNREMNNDIYMGHGNQNGICRPRILTFVNMQKDLAKDEQRNWWLIAFTVYKNLVKGNNVAQMRADLQAGIEVVRGINGSKMDMMITFKLGRILADRAKNEHKPVNQSFLEARADSIYLRGLNMLKLHNRGDLEGFHRTFMYAKANSNAVEREVNDIAEQAVLYLSERMLKKSHYQNFIDEMKDVPLPFAAYKRAEAFRKLSEANATPKSEKQRYTACAVDCLQQTLTLLKSTDFDPNHPLNVTIHNELKRLQKSSKKFNNDDSDDTGLYGDCAGAGAGGLHNNSSTYEDAEGDFFSPSNMNRSRRDVMAAIMAQASVVHATPTHNAEMDALVKRIATTLDLVKDELIVAIKPEVVSLRQEIVMLKDKVAQLEDAMNKKQASSEPPSRDDASNMLDDFYMIEDALQNQLYSQQTQQSNSMFTSATGNAALPSISYGAGASGMPQQPPTQPRIQTPNALQMQQQQAVAAAARAAAYNSQIFNQNYGALNYYASPYMIAQQNAAVAAAAANPLLAQRGQLGLPYVDPNSAATVNMNLPQPTPIFPTTPTNDNRNNAGLYNLLNQAQGTLPTLSLPPNSTLNLGQLPILTTATVTATTTTTATTSSSGTTNVTFNKALNNQPVEKGPPANVVITNSDPLPNPNSATQFQQQQQPILSVTIPPQHIKPSLVSIGDQQQQQQQQLNITTSSLIQPVTPTTVPAPSNNSFVAKSFNFNNTTNFMNKDTTTNFINSFSFKPAVEQALAASLKPEPVNLSLSSSSTAAAAAIESTPLNDSSFNELENAEYDPRPDFQPIIPLPDEIEVRTGEEDEIVMFSEHAKLYRFIDKEWKERGIGILKILRSKDGHSRLLMRRDQTHKICANHKITKDLQLKAKLEKNGYIWAAPDFADGEMRSETFYLRFKLQETAKSFAAAFEEAQRDDAKSVNEQPPPPPSQFGLSKSSATIFAASTPTSKSEISKISTTVTQKPFGMFTDSPAAATSVNATATTATSVAKPLFAGLNWSSTTTNSSANTTTTTTAPKPFANLNFGTISSSSTTTTTSFSNLFSNSAQSTVSPFSVANLNLPSFGNVPNSKSGNIFSNNTPSSSTTTEITTTTTTSTVNTSNVSDAEDDYVPTAEFKPVIELPELVDLSTGEENYLPLFENRAKLLRFDKDSREWKERGIGNIRILKHKDDSDNVRLVMRREQIHKLCLNQRLYKDIEFKYAKGSTNSLQWFGQDYSENELNTEMLTIRFKSAETCANFLEIVQKAQAAMSEKALQIEEQDERNQAQTKAKELTTTTTTPPINKGFGDAFKPKAGNWSCTGCFNSNTADKLYCPSCDTPKDDTVPKKDTNSVNSLLTNPPKTTFSFGFGNAGQTITPAPPSSTKSNVTVFGNVTSYGVGGGNTKFTFGAPKVTENATKSDFGDKFKPKAGSWTCTDCYTNNAADKMYCAACEAPKDSSVPKKETAADKGSDNNNKNILALSDPNHKFSFGFSNANPVTGTAQSSIQPVFGATTTTTTTTTNLPTLSKPTFSFSMQSSAYTSPAMPSDNTGISFSAPFSFNKNDASGVSLISKKNDPEPDDADADDSGLLHEEENNTYFTPVIPLPDKIDVKTGEEDEEVLYQHRAKLYRFVDTEWKERGIGDVKILRHIVTSKLRVVMRRDQVHKICLNHILNEDLEYKRKDDKAWLFVVNDFSEGEVSLEKLSLRFKTKEIADDFMNAIKKALSGDVDDDDDADTTSNLNGHSTESKNAENHNKSEISTNKKTEKGITEKQQTPVEPKWSLEQPILKLPENSTLQADNTQETTNSTFNLSASVSTPISTAAGNRSFSLKQSALITPTAPTTPPKTEKSLSDVSKTASPTASSFSFTAALKESETSKAPAPASVSGGFLFGNGNTNTTTTTTGGFGSSIFGGGIGSNATQPIFGQSASIFSNNNTKSKDNTQTTTTNEETKSIFDGSAIKPIFGNNVSGGSLFGGNASTTTTSESTKTNIFSGGNNTNVNNTTTSTPIFGGIPAFGTAAVTANKNGSIFGGTTITPVTVTTTVANETNTSTTTTAPTTSAISTFSFADFSSKSGGIDFASIAAAGGNNNNVLNANSNPTSAAGFVGLTNQDAFSSFQNPRDTNANNADGDGDADANGAVNDENYDPHYEPIIPLPQEIVVSTGEEDEERLFSERATLFRYDATNREWKERGVGDLKILKHRTLCRYRLLLRREQVHKLVLNFGITSEFKYDQMNNNPKSFVFGGMNYAESSAGEYERLAVRFRKVELATQFSDELKRCMEQIQQNVAA